jgi:predicted transcriptional regulator
MKTKSLTQVLERVETWPAEWQDQLAEIARDIDAELKDGVYHPTPEELAGIDRGLRDAEQGRFATEEEVEAAFAKFRGT